MSVWFYTYKSRKRLLWDGWIVLFDGSNTYWTEEMRPSGGYSESKLKRGSDFGVFIRLGELG